MSTLSITTFVPQVSWPYGGSTATLRIQYSADFQDSLGQQVLRGMPKIVTCSVVGTVLTVPQFDLITTNDGQVNPLVSCSARFYDANGTPRDWLWQNFVIPQALAPSSNIGALRGYNQGASLDLLPDFYLDRDQTVALIRQMLADLGLGPATALVAGIVRLNSAAQDPSDPVVYPTNDPLVRDALKIMGISLDGSLGTPADTNIIGFNALLGTYVAQATAIPSDHAVSHQAGGSDELDLTDMTGLLATAQVPVAHAVLHESGGLDEISVAGLLGLLADAQTPLAHNTSHESGGSDAIKLDDLAAPDDNTDLDASATAHGLLPKLSNNAAEFLNGQGAWSAAGGSGYSTVEDEGTPLTQRSTINFTGAGVTASDSGGKTVVDIPGGGGSTSFAGMDKFANV